MTAALLALPCASARAANTASPATMADWWSRTRAEYAGLRDRSECIIIGDICNSTCMLVLGIVPLQRIRVTPNVDLGFRPTNVDRRFIFGVNFLSDSGTEELMSIYPRPVKDWIRRHGGLAPQMKPLKNGHDLWMIARNLPVAGTFPCPEPYWLAGAAVKANL